MIHYHRCAFWEVTVTSHRAQDREVGRFIMSTGPVTHSTISGGCPHLRIPDGARYVTSERHDVETTMFGQPEHVYMPVGHTITWETP